MAGSGGDDGAGAPLDLSRPGRYHVVGVGGPGMSAIALTLAEMGHAVSGSDLRESPVLDRLRAAGITVHVGHDRAHVEGVDAVTVSTAIPASNIELVAAAAAGIPVLRRAAMLAADLRAGRLAGRRRHARQDDHDLDAGHDPDARPGWQPSYVVGGDVHDVGTGAHWSGGRWLVVEADESDGTHLELPLSGTILTNVEADHLDHYGTFDALVDSFDQLPRGDRRAQGAVRRRSGHGPPGRGHDVITYGIRSRRRCPGHRPSRRRGACCGSPCAAATRSSAR